ncbi:hypothetical protein F4861DRAFT_489784 [Xylaria intraflava]|nr:hypothetical protein F4861DRAFT_489784 [Xylaria intraflava]
MSRKLVLSAVRVASNGAFEGSARRIAGQQHRSFTSTHQRNAQIVHFNPTSSQALDDLLSEIRYKIILPSYLPIDQRKKIYALKWERKLQSDPIVMELDGEIIKFRHENLMTAIPNTQKSLLAAVSQFETAADFENLKPLLEGIVHAGRNIKPHVHSKIIRLLGQKGQIYHIIDCARCVRRSGFKLDNSEKVNMTLHYVQMRAPEAGWERGVTSKAFRWAEMVVDMLHDDLHRPNTPTDGTSPVPGAIALACDPFILAAPLHLGAVLVTQHEAGEDVLTKVRKFAQSVVAFWPEGKDTKELYARTNGMEYLFEPNKFIRVATPLLHGLETAAEVVEPQLASQLRSRCKILEEELRAARNTSSPERIERAMIVYQHFYDEQGVRRPIVPVELPEDSTSVDGGEENKNQ